MFLSILILFLAAGCSVRQPLPRSERDVLAELDRYLSEKDRYVESRERRIDLLRTELSGQRDPASRSDLLDSLFEEYKSYKFDSALVYARSGLEAALELGDDDRIILARRNIAFCYLSSGLFKEASDVMSTIDASGAPAEIKREYYELLARLYCDMADYSRGMPFSSDYTDLGIRYCDSVMVYAPVGSPQMLNALGLKSMQRRDFKGAIEAFTRLSEFADDHTFAIATSCIGYMYWETGDESRGLHYMALASMGDVRSATKECVALLNLSNILYLTGQGDRAIGYARIAMDDANFYNARHRKIQISEILPIIEREHMARVEGQRNDLIVFGVVVLLLCLLLFVAVSVIHKQLRRIRRARHKLRESNEIKDEYIVGSLYAKSEYLDRLESLYKSINHKIAARQYEEVRSMLREGDLKRERETMYSSFDDTFLRLFPDFVDEYNSLFAPEDRVVYNPSKGFTPELRIFALVRLGVSDSERIAKFLDYSVNTINTYKTKVKNRSMVSNEQFEQRIMSIKTAGLEKKR